MLYCFIIMKLKWPDSWDCLCGMGGESWIGFTCGIGNGGHSACPGPERSLCSVPAVSTNHDRDSWAIQRLCAFEIGCLLPANKKDRLGHIIGATRVSLLYLVSFLHPQFPVSWINPSIFYICVFMNTGLWVRNNLACVPPICVLVLVP